MLTLLYVIFLAFVKEFFDVRYSVKQIYFVELKKFCCIVGPRKVISERILTVSLAEIFLVNLGKTHSGLLYNVDVLGNRLFPFDSQARLDVATNQVSNLNCGHFVQNQCFLPLNNFGEPPRE